MYLSTYEVYYISEYWFYQFMNLTYNNPTVLLLRCLLYYVTNYVYHS